MFKTRPARPEKYSLSLEDRLTQKTTKVQKKTKSSVKFKEMLLKLIKNNIFGTISMSPEDIQYLNSKP